MNDLSLLIQCQILQRPLLVLLGETILFVYIIT